VPDRSLNVLDGSTFVVGDRIGDVRADEGREHGYFSEDTRFISRWELRVGEEPLELLSLHQDAHFDAQFFLTPRVAPEAQAPCSIVRRRLVDLIWMEEITVTNHLHELSRLHVVLEVDTDFADLFEVKDGAVARRTVHRGHDATSLTLHYENADFRRSVTISSSAVPTITHTGFEFDLALAAGERWASTFTFSPDGAQLGRAFRRRESHGSFEAKRTQKAAELETWLAQAPVVTAEDPGLLRTYRASLSDLGALRMRPDLTLGATLPAAGLPWFMALFGRDSLITSFQALPYLPGLAQTTLRVLAARQSEVRNDFHDAEPGKILHELRFGELTALGKRPHSPYFGTADATPLFLVLLEEYHRWTGDDGLVRELESHARAALDWIETSGDLDGDGYVEYERRNTDTGLINQCWKDSWDSMQFADGGLATGPVATCEIQGYVYDALRRTARLARKVWNDPTLAERLQQRADDLQINFQRDFWMPERGCHALALDGDKRQVDGLSSNIGHLLWSGILDDREAASTAERLLTEELYSGWGVRTLGAREAGYNPLGYHTGTVWPHDNSLIAAGLARYGHHEAARTIAAGMLVAAPYFQHRLPEVFAGFPRAETSVPVEFPTASRPQAWAAGTPLLLLTTLLGVEPEDTVVTTELPEPIGNISIRRDPNPDPDPQHPPQVPVTE
jgi:glycogen debranching enzyme